MGRVIGFLSVFCFELFSFLCFFLLSFSGVISCSYLFVCLFLVVVVVVECCVCAIYCL